MYVVKGKPGETARVSGVYKVCHDSRRPPGKRHRPAHVAVIIEGDTFPFCKGCGSAVSFLLIKEAMHFTHDWEFAGPPELLIGKRRDRRLAPRRRIEMPIRLKSRDFPKPLTGRSHDLSEGGLGATVEADLKNEESLAMAFKLPRSHKPMTVPSQVRHHMGRRYGFQFVRQTPAQQAQIRRCLISLGEGQA